MLKVAHTVSIRCECDWHHLALISTLDVSVVCRNVNCYVISWWLGWLSRVWVSDYILGDTFEFLTFLRNYKGVEMGFHLVIWNSDAVFLKAFLPVTQQRSIFFFIFTVMWCVPTFLSLWNLNICLLPFFVFEKRLSTLNTLALFLPLQACTPVAHQQNPFPLIWNAGD